MEIVSACVTVEKIALLLNFILNVSFVFSFDFVGVFCLLLVTDHHERVSKRARNRWFVAYTLVRNPSIKQLTASNLLKNVSTADNKLEC